MEFGGGMSRQPSPFSYGGIGHDAQFEMSLNKGRVIMRFELGGAVQLHKIELLR